MHSVSWQQNAQDSVVDDTELHEIMLTT